MKSKKYSFFIANKYYFHELEHNSFVKLLFKRTFFDNSIANLLFRFWFSQPINSILKVPFKKIWFKSILNKAYTKGSDNIFIFCEWWYDSELLQWLKSRHNDITTVLYLDDTVTQCRKIIKSFDPHKIKDEFDLVLSYNPEDVKEFGYEYCQAFFSKYDPALFFDDKIQSDISFLANVKDRGEMVVRVFEKLQKECKCDFVVLDKNQDNKYPAGIRLIKNYLSYKDYLTHEINSNCILEILKGDTQGVTFRCWEAVYYNKRLLTNWKGIKDFPFYNPQFMRYFEDENDIDIDFILDKQVPDYGYNGENSPLRLFEKIDSLISREKI